MPLEAKGHRLHGEGAQIEAEDAVGLAVQASQLVEEPRRLPYPVVLDPGAEARQLDTTRAFEKFGFRAQTSLEDGLRKTIDWYEGNH